MKALLAILIIASFMQTTILPLDLVLIILICRAYVKSDQENLYLSFTFGLVISFLDLMPLGLLSLVYLILTLAIQTFSKFRLAGNMLLIIPISLVSLLINQLVVAFYLHQAVGFPKLIVESLLSLPFVYLVKLWEERFIAQKDIKLKI